jgi:misacylated tRNA(Ala) deacylase
MPSFNKFALLTDRVAEALDGKGAGKKGRFQGKANKIQKRTDAEKMLRDYFANQQN